MTPTARTPATMVTHEDGPGEAVTSRGLAPELGARMHRNDTAPDAAPSTTPSTTRVIHVKDMPNYPDAVYIGRGMPRQGLKASKWANPYKIGDTLPTFEGMDDRRADRLDVIAMYQLRLERSPDLIALLPDLRGKPLACWCRRDGEKRSNANQCHGDVLVDLLTAYTDDELRAMAVQP